MAFNSDNNAAAMETKNSFPLPRYISDGTFVYFGPNYHPRTVQDVLYDFISGISSDCESDLGNDLCESLSKCCVVASSGSTDSTSQFLSSSSHVRKENALASKFSHATLISKNWQEYAAERTNSDNARISDTSQSPITSLDRLPVEMLYKILRHLNRDSLEQLSRAYNGNPRMSKLIFEYMFSNLPEEVNSLEITEQATVAPFLKPDYVLYLNKSMRIHEVCLFPKSQFIFDLGSPVRFGLPGDKAYYCPLYSCTASRTSIYCSDIHKTLLHVLTVLIDQRRLSSFLLRNIKLTQELVAVFEQWHLKSRVSVDMMKLRDLDLSGYSESVSRLVECFSPISFFFQNPKIYEPSRLNELFSRAFFNRHAFRRCKEVDITDLKYTLRHALSIPFEEYIFEGSWKILHIPYQIEIEQTTLLRLLKERLSGRKTFAKFSVDTKKNFSFIEHAIGDMILTEQWKGEVLKREPYTLFKLYDTNTEDFYVKIRTCYFAISRRVVRLPDWM
ncbi:unnamed protein product [Auanema sp. JU1783]|nr:unnamed protein product [Auanema sp. JU1783]